VAAWGGGAARARGRAGWGGIGQRRFVGPPAARADVPAANARTAAAAAWGGRQRGR